MSEKTYRHRVTGLVAALNPFAARAMGDLVEEVRDDAKPLVPLKRLQETPSDKKAAPATPITKEKKDV